MEIEVEIPAELLEDYITTRNNLRGGVHLNGVDYDELSAVIVLTLEIFDTPNERSKPISVF